MKKQRILKIGGFAGLAVIILILLMAMTSRSIIMPLRDGSVIRIKPASILEKFGYARCNVYYESQNGVMGTIALTDNLYNGPFVIIPSDDNKVILCLYDLEDMGLWVVKIDTTQNFKPFPAGSHLCEIIQSSPWKVEQGNIKDWEKMYFTLRSMSPNRFKRESVPGLDLAIFRVYRKKELIVQGVNDQFALMCGTR